MDELIKICAKYNNVTKNEMKNINLNIYTKNDFLNFNIYNISALFYCCINNNKLIIKYFIKRLYVTEIGIVKDKIMNPDKYGDTCLNYAFLNKHLSATKYLINTYNLTKNDLMKINRNNSLHYLFTHNSTEKIHYKICFYMFNKYNFIKNDVLAKNEWDNDLLSLCCLYKSHKSLKYLIIKYKFTKNNLKRLEKFNYGAKVKKILLINNLLIVKKYNYKKMFDLIYKKIENPLY